MKYSTLIAALFCLSLATGLRAEPYLLVTEEWAPYNYHEDNQLSGLATDIVQRIMALTGDHFQTLSLPSMRSGLTLKTRPKTIMYSLFRTAEREPLYKWVGPITQESIYPYQLASQQPVNTLEQLQQAPQITTRHAGLIPDTLQARGFTNLDKTATESLQLYRMLLAGRTHLIAGDTDAGVAYYSRKLGIAPGTLRQVPVELYRASLYIAFSPDSEDSVVAAWAAALEQLRQSGELARIQARYGSTAGQ